MRVYYHGAPSENLSHFASLAKCVGISAELFEVQNAATFIAVLAQPISAANAAAVFDVASLKKIPSQEDLEKIAALVCDRKMSALLLITDVEEATNRFLQAMTKGSVTKSRLGDQASHVNFPSVRANSRPSWFASLIRGNQPKLSA